MNKHPNSNIQAPVNHQHPNSKPARPSIRFGACSLKFPWMRLLRPVTAGLVLGAWCFLGENAHAESINPIVSAWLTSQANVQTFSADLTQTRRLKSLTQPLTSPGKVYFAEPNRFHWELGNPPQTIAVRSGDQLQVIYPKFKRVENYSLNNAGPFRDTLSLLDAGFPRSESELTAQFNIQSQIITNGICEMSLQPKSVAARRMMPQIQISFATNDFTLRATQLEFADGSTMRNDFTNIVLNPTLDDTLFAPKLGTNYTIMQPLKK